MKVNFWSGLALALTFGFSMLNLAAPATATATAATATRSPASLTNATLPGSETAPRQNFFATQGQFEANHEFELSTNIHGLSTGKGNVQGRWHATDRISGVMGWKSFAQKEGDRPKLGSLEVTVQRTQYFLGGAYSFRGRQERFDILAIPMIGFGTETDVRNVENVTGIGLAGLLQWRVGLQGQMLLEAGITADNLDDEMKADAYLGTGFQF